ncbi:MAG: UDP-N-acetylmuramate dehydrogenase [Thermostichales cyanobacterium BF4_bins_65]
MVAEVVPLIQGEVPLAGLTTWRVGGQAEWYAEPRTLAELQQCLAWAQTRSLPVTVLGAGSNVLISDLGIPGLVLHTRRLTGVEWGCQGRVRVGAGESLARLARAVAGRGWSGLEWGIGIPGSVGGAVVMNAGAQGGCMAQVVKRVEVLDGEGRLQELRGEELGFQYRSSLLQERPWIVVGVELGLEINRDPAQVLAETQQHWERRRRTQPYEWPSCGSVFRNPVPRAAGWLIEQTGLKGFRIGGAEVSQQHANFILNRNHATAQDIYQLIVYVQERVEAHWGIRLEPEVKMMGVF